MIFSSSEKIVNREKIDPSIVNHFSRASASICPSNTGISKLTCTLKGEVIQKWPLDGYVHVAIERH